MQITFAGTIIAQEPDFGGFDAVTGFLMPKRTVNSRWAEAIGGSDATPLTESPNRKRTLTGTITPPTADSLAAALLLRATAYDALPDTGALVLQVGTQIVAYENAVLDDVEVLEGDYIGVSYGFKLTFWVGPASPSTLSAPITTDAGLNLQTDSGQTIETDGP